MLPALIAAGSALAGGALSRRANERSQNVNSDSQREFAQKGIQWKVQDAKKAGIHPLFALGAQTHSFTPMAVGDSMGPAVASMGQDISRAMYAAADGGSRAATKELASLQLERAGLENELLRAQISKLASAQVGPPTPYPVASGAVLTRDLVDLKPSEVVSARSEDPSVEAGPAGPGFKEYDLGPIGKWKLPSGQVSEAIEDIEIAKYAAIMAGNHEKLGYAKNIAPNLYYQWFNRPDWVRRLEQTTHRIMLPFYRGDGKLYWKGLGSRK